MSEAPESFTEAIHRATSVAGPEARRVRGWATVEIDRAEAELSVGNAVRSRDLADDRLLGARTRLLEIEAKDDLLLLEPATEGRLAGSLARFGEGPLVLYLLVAPERFGEVIASILRAGFALSTEAPGPFGRERLVLGGPPGGPQMLVSEDGPIPPAAGAGTIER